MADREGQGIIEGRSAVDGNYRKIMEYLFDYSPQFMIATHDMELVKDAIALNNRYKKNVSYAMLNGINNSAAKELAVKGRKWHFTFLSGPDGSVTPTGGLKRLGT